MARMGHYSREWTVVRSGKIGLGRECLFVLDFGEESHMRPQHFLWVVLALTMYSARVVRGADESLDGLRKKKVEAAVQWVKHSGVDWEIPQSEKYVACLAMRDARIEAAKTKEERVTAAKTYYDQMKELYERINQLYESGRGLTRRRMEAKYLMCEAELWLMEEEGRADERLHEFRRENVEVAAKYVEIDGISFGGDIITPAEKLAASRALMHALLDAAKTKAERIEARETFYHSMDHRHAKIKLLSDDGAVGGEPRRLFEAKYRMLEARVWLEEEKKANVSVDELRNAKVKAAEEWVKALSVGGDSIPQAELLTALGARKDARLEVAKTKKERLVVLGNYHEAIKEFYRRTAGAAAHRLFEAKYRMLEAQVWLMEEKEKP
jgi:hypothetical protein